MWCNEAVEKPKTSEQDDLQKSGWIVGHAAGVVVAVLGMKHRQIQLVLNQIMNGVFEGARLELLLGIDHDHRILGVVVVLEAGYSDDSLSVCSMLPKPVRFRVFLQPQRLQHARPRNGAEGAM